MLENPVLIAVAVAAAVAALAYVLVRRFTRGDAGTGESTPPSRLTKPRQLPQRRF